MSAHLFNLNISTNLTLKMRINRKSKVISVKDRQPSKIRKALWFERDRPKPEALMTQLSRCCQGLICGPCPSTGCNEPFHWI